MGPSVGLWVHRPYSVDDLLCWMETFCDFATGGDFRWRGDHSSHLSSMNIEDDTEYFDDEIDHTVVRAERPHSCLTIGAYSSAKVNHHVVARVAVALAFRLDALIDFDGLLPAAAATVGAGNS
ncbi:DUF6368 family protein [Actinokineospora auranticolor]|uniref:Uncharacterized protein n=1 Tax=Actinokineospora auranticolor TaxID=155976 RepID=A0A2S6GKD9_9PSEU|nr:DUF6368 family protein [Actinokineospora auranticolor]PPK65687.1 hypothetical protein CLV40_113171 [Actinokineospora auranticolor]